MSSIAGMMSQQVASIQKTLNISLLNSQLATNTAQAMVMLDQVQRDLKLFNQRIQTLALLM